MAKKGWDKVYEEWREKQSERQVQRQADSHYREICQRLKSLVAQISEASRERKAIRSRIPNEAPPSTSYPSIKAEEEYLEERRRLIKELRTLETRIRTLRQEKSALEKEWIETYGAADADMEDIPDEEFELRTDFEPESDVDPFRDDWIVEPVLWAWKDPFPKVSEDMNKMDFLNRINWDAYRDDKGLIRFKIKNKPREVIREHLGSWLDLLENNGAIIFKRSGKAIVRIVGSLCLKEETGVIIELNPFAVRKSILNAVIRTLEDYGFIFERKDPLAPKAMRARKLRKEGKLQREIASTLWPEQYKTEEKFKKEETVNKKSRLATAMENIEASRINQANSCPKYDHCTNKAADSDLYMDCPNCRNAEGAFIKKSALSGLKRKSRTNPLITKVHRLLKK